MTVFDFEALSDEAKTQFLEFTENLPKRVPFFPTATGGPQGLGIGALIIGAIVLFFVLKR